MIISEIDSNEKHKVFEIENVVPPTECNGYFAALPDNANFKKILAWITQSPLIPLSPNTFGKLITDNHIEALISDGFWYFMCNYFKKGKYPSLEKDLLNRISSNFVSFYISYKQAQFPLRDKVMPQVYDIISQAIFFLFYLSYPKSRNLLTLDVIYCLCKTFFTLLNGIPASKIFIEHWILEMGNTNVIQIIKESMAIIRIRTGFSEFHQ